MPHLKKRQRLSGDSADCLAEAVSIDVLANILGYLDGPKDIMQKRRVCKKWKEAVKKTIVPLTDFRVDGVKIYNAMNVMTTELPNLQQINIGGYGDRLKYNDGEDPDEKWAARTANQTAHDIEIISIFSKLRILKIESPGAELNGRYPFLFNSFPLLQKLSLQWCYHLKWDLEMLAGFPLLKELDCIHNDCMTGSISSLRVLKDTLEKLTIDRCLRVQGNFMDLADFPHLKELDLRTTAVTGDIRDIGADDFSSLESVILPEGVYGGWGYEFQRISDGPDLVRAVYLLKKQRPALEYHCCGKLSEDSIDWYESAFEEDDDTPPFYIRVVEAGSRIGYRWSSSDYNYCCEVNWLDPEPDRESSHYEKYVDELQKIESGVRMFKGFHQPPTEEEYNNLVEDLASTGFLSE